MTNTKKITLTQPIYRGDKAIMEIELRSPNVASLKGLKVFDVMMGDTNAMITLLPRISHPALTKGDFLTMLPLDFVELVGGVVNFFAKTEQETQETSE